MCNGLFRGGTVATLDKYRSCFLIDPSQKWDLADAGLAQKDDGRGDGSKGGIDVQQACVVAYKDQTLMGGGQLRCLRVHFHRPFRANHPAKHGLAPHSPSHVPHDPVTISQTKGHGTQSKRTAKGCVGNGHERSQWSEHPTRVFHLVQRCGGNSFH